MDETLIGCIVFCLVVFVVDVEERETFAFILKMSHVTCQNFLKCSKRRDEILKRQTFKRSVPNRDFNKIPN